MCAARSRHTHGRTQDINEGMRMGGRSCMNPSMIVNNAHACMESLHGSDALSSLRTTTLVVSHSAFRFTEPECFFAALLGIHVADCVCVCHCVVKALVKVCPAGWAGWEQNPQANALPPKRKPCMHETFRWCFVSTDPVTNSLHPARSIRASLSCLVLRSRRRCGRWLLSALSPLSIRVKANVNKWTDNRRRPTCATHTASRSQNNAMSAQGEGDTPQAAPLSWPSPSPTEPPSLCARV